MVKVLHVTAQKPDSTGSGIYLSGLIKGMMDLVGEQYLLCGIDEHDSEDEIVDKFDGNVKVEAVKYGVNIGFNVPGMSDNMPYPATRYRDMTKEMAEAMRGSIEESLNKISMEFDPDLIICHHLYYATSIVRDFFPDKKIVAICHGTCLRQLKTNEFEREYIMSRIKDIDMIYALHDEQKKDIMELFCVDNVDILGSAYDNSIFYDRGLSKTNDKVVISYAGKISFTKGLVQLIQAVDRASFDKEVEFLFVGDGSVESETTFIKKLASTSRYRFDFTGRVGQAILAEYLNRSDIFVLPSFYEGLPLVILEAMACKNFVICTDIPGVRDWLGDEIDESGIIDFVDPPVMKSVSVPDEEYLDEFVDRLKISLEKMVGKFCSDEIPDVDIDKRSWHGLAKKVVSDFKNVESDF